MRGRVFDEADGTPGHESTIVNQRFVAMYLPGEDPIDSLGDGRRHRLPLAGTAGDAARSRGRLEIRVTPDESESAHADDGAVPSETSGDPTLLGSSVRPSNRFSRLTTVRDYSPMVLKWVKREGLSMRGWQVAVRVAEGRGR